MGTSISQRPKDVKNRGTFGHWELDSMVSSRGESMGYFATFIERKSRLYTAFKTPDRTATSMQTAITTLYNTLPSGACRFHKKCIMKYMQYSRKSLNFIKII